MFTLLRYMDTKPVDKCASLCIKGAQPGEQGLRCSAVHMREQTCISSYGQRGALQIIVSPHAF